MTLFDISLMLASVIVLMMFCSCSWSSLVPWESISSYNEFSIEYSVLGLLTSGLGLLMLVLTAELL